MAALHGERLVVREREGRRVWYSLHPDGRERVLALLGAGSPSTHDPDWERVVDDLALRYRGVFSRETVARCVAESRALLTASGDAPLLASRVAAFAADRLDDLRHEIASAGGRAVTVPADVTDAAAVGAAVDATVGAFGRLDILVNNAGLMRMGAAVDAPLRDWDQLVGVNVQGVLYVTRAALPHLVAAAADAPRGVADIVTISSTAGWVARPGTAVYSLTKFGVNAFSEGLRQELIGQRVRVGVVGPGTVDTEISDHLPAEARAAFAARTAGMVALRAEDIADAVGYMVTRDRRVAVNHMLVRAAEQTW
ncbi:SDR family NAD(P)-dependent oxidoreductase [Mycobacterium sp. PS03-16]|nr:SDR family NAD(P)-dependent oxidoreductase [Mycobacterium sp. PS03-16]